MCLVVQCDMPASCKGHGERVARTRAMTKKVLWKARGDTGFYEFDRSDPGTQYILPERFYGLV